MKSLVHIQKLFKSPKDDSANGTVELRVVRSNAGW